MRKRNGAHLSACTHACMHVGIQIRPTGEEVELSELHETLNSSEVSLEICETQCDFAR